MKNLRLPNETWQVLHLRILSRNVLHKEITQLAVPYKMHPKPNFSMLAAHKRLKVR